MRATQATTLADLREFGMRECAAAEQALDLVLTEPRRHVGRTADHLLHEIERVQPRQQVRAADGIVAWGRNIKFGSQDGRRHGCIIAYMPTPLIFATTLITTFPDYR